MKKCIIALVIFGFFLFLAGCGTQSDGLEISSDVKFGKNDYKGIISSQNELGLDCLREIKRDVNGNTFYSPTSLFMALSMVYNGAGGVTKDEIAKVLHIDEMDTRKVNQANASLMTVLHNHSKDIELDVANSVWAIKPFHFQKEFSQTNKDYFNAKIQVVDFKDAKVINNWVSEATNKKIKDIVDVPLDPDVVAILINAIYFKGNWKNEFDKKNTVEGTFHLEDGSTKHVALMTLNKNVEYMENESFQAVSLPYGKGEMSMKVFLPKENVDLEDLEKQLTYDHWQQWTHEFQHRQGRLMLPKFKLKYEVLLNDTLKKLGMETAFAGGANFSKMINETTSIWISKVKQKTFINVNEKGSEAAAATSVQMTKSAAPIGEPFHMKVNRPFLLTIVDERSGAILFMGTIVNPQNGK